MLEEQSVLCGDGGRGFGQVAWQQLSLLLLRLVVLVLRVVLVGLMGAGAVADGTRVWWWCYGWSAMVLIGAGRVTDNSSNSGIGC